jgi:hypothetical protein
MRSKIQWPTAAVIMTTIVALTTLALAGPSLGLSDDILRYALGGAGGVGALIAGLRPQLFASDDGGQK